MKTKQQPSPHELDIADQLQHSVFRLLRLIRGSRPAGELSWARISVLGGLQTQGPTTATALAAYLGVKPQSLTRLLADLEESGLITRRPDKADRRQSLLKITPAGTALLRDEMREQRLTLARIIGQKLTPAEQEMLRLAAGLMDKLATENQDSPPPA